MLSAFQFEIGRFAPVWTWSNLLYWRSLQLVFLLAILMLSLVGLLAIWAGLGRGHWFLRVAVVLGAISLLLAIPAFELVIVYVLQAGLTIVALLALQNWRLAHVAALASGEAAPGTSRRSPWQFSILDMLLLTVVAAWLCAMLVRVPAAVWATWPLLLAEGAITAGLTITAAWAGLSDHRRWLYVPTCVILFPAALMAAWLGLWRRTVRPRAASPWQSRKSRLAQAMLTVASLAMLTPVVGVCWRLAHPRTFVEPARPSTNSYGELVRAFDLTKTAISPTFETFTRAQWKTFVRQCGPVYAPVRAALDKPCQVPVRLNSEDFAKSVAAVQSLRGLSRALYAQGRLAAMEGRNKEAVRSYTDTIRLGRAAMRDGLLVDMLVGITIEGIGRDGIAKMRKSLSAGECQTLLPKLSDLIDRPAMSADILARSEAWEDNAYGWQGRLAAVIEELPGSASRKAMEHACNRELAQSRLLLCELAIRAYSLQHGRNPATLADLVPSFLPKVPKDPFGGGDFVYRLTPKGYELRSRQVGVQGKPITADDPS